jgi:RNA polymerase sigma factor (sigma-70 family)
LALVALDRSWHSPAMPEAQSSLDVLTRWLGNAVNLQWLKRQIRRRDRGPEDVDDLIQEAILRVTESCRRGEARDPASVLVRTVSRLSMNDCRDRARHPHVNESVDELEQFMPLIDATPMPEELIDAEQRWALIAETLETVSDRMRQAFLLSRVHELTYAQIAARLRVSERTIKEDITRVMAFLIDAAHRKQARHDSR